LEEYLHTTCRHPSVIQDTTVQSVSRIALSPLTTGDQDRQTGMARNNKDPNHHQQALQKNGRRSCGEQNPNVWILFVIQTKILSKPFWKKRVISHVLSNKGLDIFLFYIVRLINKI